MAIIPCRECAHHVSDQAASCPSCGAPVTQAVKTRPRGRRRVISRTLITLMALWTLGTLVWLIIPSEAPDQLTTRAKASLQRLDRGIEHFWRAEPTRTTQRVQAAPRPPAETQSVAALPVSSQPARSVYRTTAEQLYRDYAANVVATQTKIGTSRVRLAGSVAEIDQDETGRPVVKLWADKDTTAAMTLADNQRAAAAQLARNEAVEVECDKIGRSGAKLEGSGCTLALIDLRPKEVNLALVLANESGPTRVYVVGPMPETVCQERSAEISSTLQKTRQGEHVVARNCTEAARERIAPEGCRLNASAVNVAEVPTAHLWRYDCSSSSVARASRRKKLPPNRPAYETTLPAIVANATTDSSASPDSRDPTAAQPIPLPVRDSVVVPTAPVERPTMSAGTAPHDTGIVGPAPAATERTTNNMRFASAGNSDTGTVVARVPAEESTVAHATQLTHSEQSTQPAAATSPDDLARVRAADPQAADHIATYCAQTTASTNRDTYIADCRHSEAEAWVRFVQQNEFPTLDEATRRRCSQPPFPDTYVAKESCARYLLHVN
jgi:hypothetical protein